MDALLFQIYLSALSIKKQIDGYEAAGLNSTISGSAFVVDKDLGDIVNQMARDRLALTRQLSSLPHEGSEHLAVIDDVHLSSGRLRGALFGYALSDEETKTLESQREIFLQNWAHPRAFPAFTGIGYYYQPFELPLQKNISQLSPAQLSRYLHFVLRQPHIMQAGDEEKYVAYYEKLTDWLLHLLAGGDGKLSIDPQGLIKLVSKALTYGACYYIDRPIGSLVRARARVVEAVVRKKAGLAEIKSFQPKAPPSAHRTKIRIGILSRNAGDYTDTRALYAMFHAFDKSRYEIFWYSLDVFDPTTISDITFFRALYGMAEKLTSLRGNAVQQAQQILQDDLDILFIGSAYSFSAAEMDQMLFKKLARVQIQLNALVPGSSGFASYDYLIVPESDGEAMASYREESTEEIRQLDAPLVWYEKRPQTQPDEKLTRAALGIPENAVVYCSGAAANKQLPGTLSTWLEILQKTPNSYLLFYPFNPAWGGYFIGLTFLARLRALMKNYPGIERSRIVVVRGVSPEEGNRLMMLSDIYLGSFPHGGATSAMLAMRHGKPVVARKSRWLRSTSDPSLVASVGLEELIGKDNEEVTAIAVKLGTDAQYYADVCKRLAEQIETAPFFDIGTNSRKMQALTDAIAREKGLAYGTSAHVPA
jgi:predicted O-linked N-acetylglucosamine transferase (SPINDLY family)